MNKVFFDEKFFPVCRALYDNTGDRKGPSSSSKKPSSLTLSSFGHLYSQPLRFTIVVNIIMAKKSKSDSGEDNGSSSSGSSSEEDVKPITTQVPSNTRSSDSSSSSDDDDGEWNKKKSGKRSKKTSKAGSKVKKVKKSDEEREEGELDDEDDDDLAFNSEDDEDIEEFNDGFDENLMGDEEDQQRLKAMTEAQREQELFNRSEKREVLRTRFEIERKLRLQKRAEMNRQNKSKGSQPKTNVKTSVVKTTASVNVKDYIDPDFPNETSIRSTERRRNMDEKNTKKDALKVMKELREKKKLKQQKLRAADVYSSSSDSDDDSDTDDKNKSGRNRRRRSSSSSSSSSSSDDSEDKTRRKGKRRASSKSGSDREEDDQPKEEFVVTVETLNSVRLSRIQVGKWVHAPFFPTTIISSYVKMGIGQKEGEQVYRICQVLDVTEGPKTYDLEKTKTNKVIKVRHGKQERPFRMEYISNSDFTDKEFLEWQTAMQKSSMDMPSKSQIESKKKDIQFANNYRFTEHDIEAILREKEKFNKNPKNYAVKKTTLMKLKEHADQAGDDVESERIQAEIDQLEERAKELDQKRTTSIAGITTINERNRIRNIAEAERAIMEESAKEALNKTDDPFRRRQCAPQLYGSRKKIIKGEAIGEVKSEPSVDDNNGNNNVSVIDSKEDILKPSSPKEDHASDDLFNAHNFDIQIEFDIGMPTNSGLGAPSAFSGLSLNHTHNSIPDVKPVVNNRRSLNLEEYKKKKGLI